MLRSRAGSVGDFLPRCVPLARFLQTLFPHARLESLDGEFGRGFLVQHPAINNLGIVRPAIIRRDDDGGGCPRSLERFDDLCGLVRRLHNDALCMLGYVPPKQDLRYQRLPDCLLAEVPKILPAGAHARHRSAGRVNNAIRVDATHAIELFVIECVERCLMGHSFEILKIPAFCFPAHQLTSKIMLRSVMMISGPKNR